MYQNQQEYDAYQYMLTARRVTRFLKKNQVIPEQYYIEFRNGEMQMAQKDWTAAIEYFKSAIATLP